MKHVIENRDINDPEEFKEIEPVQLDLASLEELDEPQAADFSAALAVAASEEQEKIKAEKQRTMKREAQALASERFKAVAEEINKATGVSIGFKEPYAYTPKPKVAYDLWKRVVPLLVQDAKALNRGPTALAGWLDGNEPNYTITRDMMYDPLNEFAVDDLKHLLRNMGVTLKLKPPISIRSIQKELQARRDAKETVDIEKFSGRFEIRGDMAYVNGKGYRIQRNASGKRRIKRSSKQWLPLDTLKAFCTGNG